MSGWRMHADQCPLFAEYLLLAEEVGRWVCANSDMMSLEGEVEVGLEKLEER